METLTAASSSIICTKPLGPLGSPARAPNHRVLQALQQRVLDLALKRLADCLASPCDRAREVCLELGVAHGDLEAAFRRRQQQCCVGEQQSDGVCEAPSQVRPWRNNLTTSNTTSTSTLTTSYPRYEYSYTCTNTYVYCRMHHIICVKMIYSYDHTSSRFEGLCVQRPASLRVVMCTAAAVVANQREPITIMMR